MGAAKDAQLAKKQAYFQRLQGYLATYSKCIVVDADNVGSRQFAQIRLQLRGTAEVLMGKNTMMRKAFTQFLETNPDHPYGKLLPSLVLNIGLIFTNASLTKVREIIMENVVPAAARVGSIAPFDIIVPAGPTGADPGKTGFFQALNIPTKIVRGQIEIINDVHLISQGEKVNPGSASLLKSLDMKPFFYGLKLVQIFENGAVFDPAVLDMTDDIIRSKFMGGARKIAAIGLIIGYPTLASVPHSLTNALKRLVALCIPEEITYTFEKAEPYLAFLADPSAFAGAAAPAAGAAAAVVEEEESEEEAAPVQMGGMFGSDSDSDSD